MKKSPPSQRVQSLCVDLKTQLDLFEKTQAPSRDTEEEEARRQALLKSLTEKIKSLSS